MIHNCEFFRDDQDFYGAQQERNASGARWVQYQYFSLMIRYNTLTICKTIALASQGPYFVEFSTVSISFGNFAYKWQNAFVQVAIKSIKKNILILNDTIQYKTILLFTSDTDIWYRIVYWYLFVCITPMIHFCCLISRYNIFPFRYRYLVSYWVPVSILMHHSNVTFPLLNCRLFVYSVRSVSTATGSGDRRRGSEIPGRKYMHSPFSTQCAWLIWGIYMQIFMK